MDEENKKEEKAVVETKPKKKRRWFSMKFIDKLLFRLIALKILLPEEFWQYIINLIREAIENG